MLIKKHKPEGLENIYVRYNLRFAVVKHVYNDLKLGLQKLLLNKQQFENCTLDINVYKHKVNINYS